MFDMVIARRWTPSRLWWRFVFRSSTLSSSSLFKPASYICGRKVLLGVYGTSRIIVMYRPLIMVFWNFLQILKDMRIGIQLLKVVIIIVFAHVSWPSRNSLDLGVGLQGV
jgi:hypothetical protein